MRTSVCEIHVSSQPDSAYFLRVDGRGRGLGSGFQLLLTDGQDAWRGEVSEAAVRTEAEELEMQRERYVQDLQQALTGSGGSVTYSFTLTPSPPGPALTLAYEKVQKDISFRLGSVSLQAVPEPAEAVRELLVHSLQRGNTLEHQNQNLEEENQRLRREQQRITAELKRYTGGKEALEAELYSRFILVLNEKKAKIRSLQETVTHLQETRYRHGNRTLQSDVVSQCFCFKLIFYIRKCTACLFVDCLLSSADSSTPSPLDDSLRDITDVAPCRKRRVCNLEAPEPAVKRSTPQTSKGRRYESVFVWPSFLLRHVSCLTMSVHVSGLLAS
uniref:X-ray repair complementing defective repair in Chinese hamster cells 4 n=1 Tax=Seriola lalandi dorsalis TaxID=1841481 RepID=A0A3B4YM78_SERLL